MSQTGFQQQRFIRVHKLENIKLAIFIFKSLADVINTSHRSIVNALKRFILKLVSIGVYFVRQNFRKHNIFLPEPVFVELLGVAHKISECMRNTVEPVSAPGFEKVSACRNECKTCETNIRRGIVVKACKFKNRAVKLDCQFCGIFLPVAPECNVNCLADFL